MANVHVKTHTLQTWYLQQTEGVQSTTKAKRTVSWPHDPILGLASFGLVSSDDDDVDDDQTWQDMSTAVIVRLSTLQFVTASGLPEQQIIFKRMQFP